MAEDIIQVKYDQLEQLASHFGQASEDSLNLLSKTAHQLQALQNGGWQGKGAAAFYAEMDQTLFPALRRLIQALNEAQSVTLEIKQVIQQAEAEAANPFKGTSIIATVLDSQTAHALGYAAPGYNPPADPETITLEYWQGLTKEEQKQLHYERNRYQEATNIPLLEKDLAPDEWESKGEAIAHNLGKGVAGNTDYRGIGKRAHQQAVYDSKGQLVKTPENMGTFDFSSPSLASLREHWEMDVNPWIEWGNSPEDTTTREERIKALRSSFLGNLGYLLYGPK